MLQYSDIKKLVWILHRSPVLRFLSRRLFKGFTLKQSFYNGIICFDPIESSYMFRKDYKFDTYDTNVLDALLLLSWDYEIMIDIGCNVGAMVLSVLLRNPNIKAICIDPNPRAIALLKESIRINKLTSRISTIEAVVSDKEGAVRFAKEDFVTSHVSELGDVVRSISFADLINSHSCSAKCLVKIDVEGLEAILMRQLAHLAHLHNLCFMIELHPLGYNDTGNPEECLNLLLESGAVVSKIEQENGLNQVIAMWKNE